MTRNPLRLFRKFSGAVRSILWLWGSFRAPDLRAVFFFCFSTNRDRKKGVITKGVFSREESLELLKSLNSLESLENGRTLLRFPQSGGSLESLESLESLNSLESLENGLF